MESLNGERATGDSEGRSIAKEFGELIPRNKKPEQQQERVGITFSAFIVADVTISFRSRLRDKTVEWG